MSRQDEQVVVIGAGPAGLTAAYALVKAGKPVTVFEADDVVGGISRTVERDGWRFDIGGHRFFTKVGAVEDLWHEILPDEDFLLRPRMSRIYYDNKLFDYPLKASNALKNLGIVEAVKCVLSYIWVRIHPPKDQSTLEGWVAARFGWRLYRTFFKTYNEKVWGVPASEIASDWAAQRIKNLSLFNAVVNSLLPRRNQTEITTLIEEFQYPKYGPGMMWERAHELVTAGGGTVVMETGVTAVTRDDSGATAVVTTHDGNQTSTPASAVVSSMPLPLLVLAMDPPAPDDVQRAAHRLSHRDFLTVALVVPASASFPDNWIYIHSPDVKVGRIQNFGSWSPYLVKDGRTCLGLEYFVFEGDELWTMRDDDLAVLAEIASETNAHFISISGPEIMSKFYGESEARIREIFKESREKAPSIIFIDEIDSIAPKREEVTGEVERRVVSQLLSVMDGLEARGKVIVIAATNRPNAIDPALRRPGRFDREIEIKVPDKRGRLEILQIHTHNMPLESDVNQEKIAAVTHGFVGADLEYLCKEAAMKCLRRLLPELNLEDEKISPETLDKLVITMNDFENAIKDVMPSAMREVYLEIT